MSFASFAIGSNDVVATSIAPSIAVLIISAIRTNEIARSSAISSSRETFVASPTMRTMTAIAKWIRMFRWVRSTWMIPSKAKLKLSISDGGRRCGVVTRAPPRARPSPRRGRNRAGAGARARAAHAIARRRPAGRGRRHRARAGRPAAARLSRRSGTRARRSPRRRQGVRASACGSRPARRTRVRALRRRPPPRRGPSARARPRRPRRPRRRFGWKPRSRSSPRACGARLLRVMLVRLDDPLHELVPDDVLVREADEGDAVDAGQDVLYLDEARRLLARQVDDLRAEAEPCQEHLHLLRARVLRLVEDDERVVEGAAAHERERCDLDDPLVEVRLDPVGLEHVVQRVEQRPQVRIDLREHVARQEAEPLPGLHSKARGGDPRHLALLQRSDGERHREVRLARAGRADAERHRAAADLVDVVLLRHRLGRDLLAAVAPYDVVEDLADVVRLVERAEHGVHRRRADLVPALDQLDELVDDRARLDDLRLVAFDRQAIAAQANGAVESVAERIEDAVAHAGELRGHVVRDVENFLHETKCRPGAVRRRPPT